MVIGLPRSGTTWAANWLTTAHTFCQHDPLWTIHPDDLDSEVAMAAGDRMAGISCTGLWRLVDRINAHPARKLVLRRDTREVKASMQRLGLPSLPIGASRALDRIEGEHLPFEMLFDPVAAAGIWEYLTAGLPFDAMRHRELVQMNIQPAFARVRRDADLNRRLAAEMRQ